MGYDYSRGFMLSNIDMVNTLRELVTTEHIVLMEFDSYAEARKYQFYIRNVAKVASVYEPQNAHAFHQIRTWAQPNNDGATWQVFVGLPKHKAIGRRPQAREYAESVQRLYKASVAVTQQVKLVEGLEERYPITVKDALDAATLKEHLAKTKFDAVRVSFSTEVSDDPYWNPIRNMGWSLIIDGSYVTFTRAADAAKDNL